MSTTAQGPTPPKPRGRVKHQRRRALFSTMSNTPTQLLVARIAELEGRISAIEETLTAVVDRANALSMFAKGASEHITKMDVALGWVMQTIGVTGPPNQRTEGGLILPPGIEMPDQTPVNATTGADSSDAAPLVTLT